MSSKRKRYNAYRSSSDPLPQKRSRSRHLKAFSENIHENIPEAFFSRLRLKTSPTLLHWNLFKVTPAVIVT
jgi:hypothetical protein